MRVILYIHTAMEEKTDTIWNLKSLFCFLEERDRRYYEVDQEREKALKIKEQGNQDALELARQIQTYKDEKANQLREQINSERGIYATKADLRSLEEKVGVRIDPVVTYVSAQTGKGQGLSLGWALLMGGLILISTLISIASSIVALWFLLKH